MWLPVVVGGTIDASNCVNSGLYLAGCSHEMSYGCWVDDNRCRHFGGMIVVGASYLLCRSRRRVVVVVGSVLSFLSAVGLQDAYPLCCF